MGTVEGKSRTGRGAQLVHNKDMLPCVRQEHFTSMHVSEVWLCAKFPKGRAFTSGCPNKEVACVSSAVISRGISRLEGVGSVD